jgi:PEP-CTERM putative exosortase interaction domain
MIFIPRTGISRIKLRNRSSCAAALSLVFSIASGAAHAGLTEVQLTDGYFYKQTATGVAPDGAFFDAEASSQNPSDFNGGILSYSGLASPQALVPVLGSFSNPQAQSIGFESGITSAAAISSAYPFGTYTFTLNNSTTSATQTASLDYSQNAFTADIPALTSTSYAELQNADATQALTLQFNSFTPNVAATNSALRLKIIDLTSNTSFMIDNAAPASTTSALLQAGALAAGSSYEYVLVFSDDISGVDSASGVKTDQFSGIRTYGFFSTAPVPEPDTYALMLSGLGLIGFAVRRRRARL